jgi:hypothetical protein
MDVGDIADVSEVPDAFISEYSHNDLKVRTGYGHV